MKHLILASLFSLSSLPSFAACPMTLETSGANGDILSRSTVARKADAYLGYKGYFVESGGTGAYKLRVHYTSMLTTHGSDTVGIEVKVENAEKKVIASSSTMPELGRLSFVDKLVARAALKEALSEIADQLPACN